MRSTADIIFGVTGQLLRHRVRAGRPTSATFSVFADDAGDDDEAEFSGTATVDAVSTALSAAAGVGEADPTAIPLTSAASVAVGRRYLISESGRREWTKIVALDGSTAYAPAPLQNAYTTSATFVGCDLTAAVDATWVADEGNLSDPSVPEPDYRARWEILIGGATQVAYTFFDLLRGAVDHGITIDDLEGRLWNVMSDLPVEHRADQGGRIIDAAWEDVQSDLAGNRVNDAALRDASIVDQLLMRKIRLTFAQNGHVPRGMPADVALADARAEYQRFFERMIAASSSVPIAKSTSGGARLVAPRLWRP